MWCNEVQEGLPLLDPDDPEAAELLAHAGSCPACRELLQAHRADERLFEDLRAERSPAPLAGFADGVMARLREQGPAAPLPLSLASESQAPLVKATPQAPRGQLISFASLSPLAALAAAVLVTAGLLVTVPRANPLPAPSGGLAQQPTPPVQPAAPAIGAQLAADPAPAPADPAPFGPAVAIGEPLPAPALSDPAPIPLRRGPARNGMEVVPVEGGGNGGLGVGPGDLPPDLRRMLERALPGLQRLIPPPRPPEKRPDEVRF